MLSVTSVKNIINIPHTIIKSSKIYWYITKTNSSFEIRNRRILTVKCFLIMNYNKFMGKVDRADQFGSMYCFLRKSLKWWRKVFFWGIGICSLNSYILYKADCKHNNSKPMYNKNFMRKLVLSLIGNWEKTGNYIFYKLIQRENIMTV